MPLNLDMTQIIQEHYCTKATCIYYDAQSCQHNTDRTPINICFSHNSSLLHLTLTLTQHHDCTNPPRISCRPATSDWAWHRPTPEPALFGPVREEAGCGDGSASGPPVGPGRDAVVKWSREGCWRLRWPLVLQRCSRCLR